MRRDLFLLWHCLEIGERELPRHLDETTDPKPVTGEVLRHEVIEFFGIRHRAVRPEIGRDILFRKLRARVPSFGQPHEPADHECTHALHEAGVPDGKGRGDKPGYHQDDHGEKKYGKPCPRGVIDAGKHMIGVLPDAVTKTIAPCARMKPTNQANEMKWTDRIACRLKVLPSQPSALEIAGLCIMPVKMETGAAMNTVIK